MITRPAHGEGVRRRILFPFTMLLCFVIAAFVLSTYVVEKREHKKELESRVAAMDRLFLRRVENDSAMMRAALLAISRNQDIQRAFLRQDREALLERSWPLFEALRRDNSITHFYFSDTRKKVFLRVHQPTEYGDVIDRATTERAVQSQTVVSGLEIGPLGTLTLRVVLPWYRGKTLIGYLELGEEIELITEEVNRILGVGVLALVDSVFLPGSTQARKTIGHDQAPTEINGFVVVANSMGRIPANLRDRIGSHDAPTPESFEFEEGETEYYASVLPLTDTTQRVIGKLVALHDVTGSQDTLYRAMWLVSLLSISLAALVYAVFYVILGRVERDASRQRDIELKLSRVNIEHQKVVQIEKLSAMGLMVGEIAHQLNNPLVGVVNMSQLAIRRLDNPERLKELLQDIGSAGKECHSFVRRMLEFTRISSFHMEPSDLNKLVKDSLSLITRSFGRKVQVDLELPELAPVVSIDPLLLRHALFNLLVNAIQASPENGKICLQVYRCRRQKIAGWCLAVRDSGPGVPTELRERIFTPFYTTRAEGTGLGLPVVQHVAILHEGDVWVEDAPEGGAKFIIWVPESTTDLNDEST